MAERRGGYPGRLPPGRLERPRSGYDPRRVATWVIGDVQGCFTSLRRLLARIGYERGRDRIWFVGDLVNRGPASVETLRFVRDQGDSAVAVLGNHDLHLLAQRDGIVAPRRGDTLDGVLAAPDADELCDWLARRPFVHTEGRFTLVHAGFLPEWSWSKIEKRARAAEAALARDRRDFLSALYALLKGRPASRPSPGVVRAARSAIVFTRIRTVGPDGVPDLDFDSPPEAIPPAHRPWFEAASLSGERTVLFGHWAALGLMAAKDAVCLDSGCVWNGSLTAMRLEDGAFTVEPAAAGDGQRPPPARSERRRTLAPAAAEAPAREGEGP